MDIEIATAIKMTSNKFKKVQILPKKAKFGYGDNGLACDNPSSQRRLRKQRNSSGSMDIWKSRSHIKNHHPSTIIEIP